MTSISAGHIILTLTQPVGSGRPLRGSKPGPPHQESPALPTELPHTPLTDNEDGFVSNGLLKDRTVKLSLRKTNSKNCKARVPPYAERKKIEGALRRLESNGIIKKVESADWATPIVSILKKYNTFRTCGDYKTTVNKQIRAKKITYS